MTFDLDEQRLERVARSIDPSARLVRAWPLTGGVSATVTALEIERRDGQRQRLLVRRHGAADLAHNPRIARDEFRLLEIVLAHGLPVPAPYRYDESGAILPSPYLVVAFVDGAPDFEPPDPSAAARRMAEILVRIHALRGLDALAFLPRQRSEPPPATALDTALREPELRAALAALAPAERRNPITLLHGDYWPGNILWRDGELVAVIDWEDARIGDPLADTANCRYELTLAWGLEPADAFAARYRALAPLDETDLPRWELLAALRPCGKLASWELDPVDERRIRERHGAFVARVLARLQLY